MREGGGGDVRGHSCVDCFSIMWLFYPACRDKHAVYLYNDEEHSYEEVCDTISALSLKC